MKIAMKYPRHYYEIAGITMKIAMKNRRHHYEYRNEISQASL
jgi:hypothetical protein